MNGKQLRFANNAMQLLNEVYRWADTEDYTFDEFTELTVKTTGDKYVSGTRVMTFKFDSEKSEWTVSFDE